MPNFKCAFINEEGLDLILIPMDDSFENNTSVHQMSTIGSIQYALNSAGIAGTIVPVWKTSERMSFRAPRELHPFLETLSWEEVQGRVSRTIPW